LFAVREGDDWLVLTVIVLNHNTKDDAGASATAIAGTKWLGAT